MTLALFAAPLPFFTTYIKRKLPFTSENIHSDEKRFPTATIVAASGTTTFADCKPKKVINISIPHYKLICNARYLRYRQFYGKDIRHR